ncbi:MAG: hypothetical protein RBU37_08055 [Myxococcota bacterium]|jgi:hypothetical protein|nr:hypothetical protein [Myxococcota bacterium]
MSRLFLALTVALVLFLACATDASAQLRAGPSLGYGFDAERAILGLDVWYDASALGESSSLQLNAAFGGYLLSDVVFLRGDLNVPFVFAVSPEALSLFLGPGFSFAYKKVDLGAFGSSDGYDLGLSSFLGMLIFPDSLVSGQLQVRLTLGDWVSRMEAVTGVLIRF